MSANDATTAHALTRRVNALTSHYRRVRAGRMAGLPVLNAVLDVEATGFEWVGLPEEGASPVAEGVLITPWFMSLVRLPLANLPHGNRVGKKSVRAFGCEHFEFIGAHDDSVGYHESCALFSPMDEFNSQNLARDTAIAVLAQLRRMEAPAIAPRAEPVSARRAFFSRFRPDRGAPP